MQLQMKRLLCPLLASYWSSSAFVVIEPYCDAFCLTLQAWRSRDRRAVGTVLLRCVRPFRCVASVVHFFLVSSRDVASR